MAIFYQQSGKRGEADFLKTNATTDVAALKVAVVANKSR